MIENLIELDELPPSGLNFVLNSWMRSTRINPVYRRINSAVFFNNHEMLINKCLNRSNVVIATPTSAPSLIIGYICFDDSHFTETVTVHYCYVKSDYRKMGIATYLFNLVTEGKHAILTHDAGDIPNTTYNPYEFWSQDGRAKEIERYKEQKYN